MPTEELAHSYDWVTNMTEDMATVLWRTEPPTEPIIAGEVGPEGWSAMLRKDAATKACSAVFSHFIRPHWGCPFPHELRCNRGRSLLRPGPMVYA